MHRLSLGVAAFAALVAGSSAQAQVKIGMIVSYSGQFADTGNQLDNGFKLYMKQKGDTVAGKKVEVIRKDNGGIAPDVAKRLAQELIVRDKVDILGGFELTPNALAVGDVSAEAKKFMVVMNAATSIITTKSPYMARTSVTTPMLNDALGTWAAKNGIKKVYTLVSDFGPGHDAVAAFKEAFVKSAVGNFGSGWTWLVKKADGSVDIVNTGPAGTPLTTADKALMTVDVWEHAYYIDYRNQRPKFVETFLASLVNWSFAEANFA